jgi:hypothetical protein
MYKLILQDAIIVEILLSPVDQDSIELIQQKLKKLQEFKQCLYGNGKSIPHSHSLKY